MGRDNHPRQRLLAREKRNKNTPRPSHARILIVTEGAKTEPSYFKEIRKKYRLSSASVAILPARSGTAPEQIVQEAIQLFKHGDQNRGIAPESFDQVYTVFDRDQHASFSLAVRSDSKVDFHQKNHLVRPEQPASPLIPSA